jgi:hypothetical protein
MGHNLFKRVPEELVMVIMAHLSLPDLLCSAALVRPSSLGIALSKKSGQVFVASLGQFINFGVHDSLFLFWFFVFFTFLFFFKMLLSTQTCRRFAEVVSNDAFWQEKCKTMLSPADLSVCVRSLDSATSKQHETKSPNRLLRWKDIGQALAGFQWSEQLKSTGIAISSDLMEAECHDGSWNSVRANSPLQRGRWRLWFNIRKPPSNSSKNTAVGYSHLDYGSSKEWSSHVNCFMKDSTTGKSFGLHESMRVYYTKSRYCDSPMLPAVKDESYPMGLELDLFEVCCDFPSLSYSSTELFYMHY